MAENQFVTTYITKMAENKFVTTQTTKMISGVIFITAHIVIPAQIK